MRRSVPLLVVGFLAIGAGAVGLAADTKPGDDFGGLAAPAAIDEFNDQVKDKVKGDEKPVRGGVIRVRMPSDPKSLNAIIDNDETTVVAYWYMNDQLIDRDKETLEWLPFLSRYWKMRDKVHLKDGRVLEGRVVSETADKVVFAEGASKWTLARHEVVIDEAGGKVTWKEGFGKGDLLGKISYWPGGKYTVTVEEKPAKTIDIPTADIQPIEEETDSNKVTVSGVIRECVIEFKLREGPRWHDGKPVTADDFVFSYETEMNPAVLDGQIKGVFLDIMDPDVKKACCKVGDDVVRYELKKQYFAALSAVGTNYVIPAHRYGREKFKGDDKGFGEYFNTHPENAHPTGNSRYKFSKWETNKVVEVVRNDDWWASKEGYGPGQGVPWIDPKMPYLDKIQWITISQAAGVKALMNDEVDSDFDIEQTKWVDPETNSTEFTNRFVRATFTSPTFTYIGWNQRRPEGDSSPIFFKDAKVRMAMTMLIDRQKILKNVHFGLGEEVTGPFFSKGPNNDPSLKPIPYNPEKAKALLDEAGWIDHTGSGIRDKDGVKFEFTYNVHNAREYHMQIAVIVKEDIEKAGIKVNIKSTEFNAFQDIVNSRKFDAVRFALGDPDPLESDPYQTWHSSQWDNKGQNITYYASKEADDMLLRARRELDFRKRARLFKKLHRTIYEEQPYTFLFNLKELYVYDKKFRNVKFRVFGQKPFCFDEWFIPKELQKEKAPKQPTMWAYLLKRFLLIFVTLFGICLISFVLVTLAPGDPAATAAGVATFGAKGGHAKDEVLEHTRRALYLDRPVIVNFSPNSRRSVARDLVKKLCVGSDYTREGAHDEILGGVGTAGLDVFVEEATRLAASGAEASARVKKALEGIDAAAKNAAPTDAAVDAAVAPLEAEFPGRGPRFSKKASAVERARSWSSWGHGHEKEPEASAVSLLELLEKLVPESAGGPKAPTGTPVERAATWSGWWEKNASRFSTETISKAVVAYLDATADVASDRLADLVRIGGAATAPIMAELLSSTGDRKLRAAFALSLVAHKPWDLRPSTLDYELEWKARKEKIDGAELAPAVRASELEALGDQPTYVARESAREVRDQERSIARWWFRSEEEFTDFGAVRQIGRGFTQTQFGNWFRALAGGLDLGKSFSYKKNVSTLIAERLPVTLWLNFFSIVLTYIIAIPLGIFSATHPRSLADRVSTVTLFILYSLPSFWVGAILILLLTGPPVGVSWFPSHGMEDINAWKLGGWDRFVDWIRHMILPVTCLTYGGIAYVSRQMRAGMLETIRQDYIRTARAKGLSENVVVFKHALRNSMIPTLTLLAYLLPYMFGGSVIIESIFSINGLGMLMFDAILKRDYPVIMSEVFISGLLTLFGVLLADISYAIVDPRIELK